MANEFQNVRESVGIGRETTSGTGVASGVWISQSKMSGYRKTKTVDNNSALGRIEESDDSAVTSQWFEGSLDGRVTDITIGYLLYAIFGQLTTAANADGSGTVKDHTLNVLTGALPTFTFNRKDPVDDYRHPLGQIDNLDITIDKDGWVMFSSNIKAQPGASSSNTVSYVSENAFTSAHIILKLATNVAGLTGATVLDPSSIKLSMKRKVDLYIPLGSKTPTKILPTERWSASGSFVIHYNATTQRDLWFNNTVQALQFGFKNTDVTIGTSANPQLLFTAPKARLNAFDLNDGLADESTATIGFKTELDLTAGYTLRAVLTNLQASY